MQSTGQTATHALSFTPMHGSVMIYAIRLNPPQRVAVGFIMTHADSFPIPAPESVHARSQTPARAKLVHFAGIPSRGLLLPGGFRPGRPPWARGPCRTSH